MKTHAATDYAKDDGTSPLPYTGVTDMALRRDGAVAWIAWSPGSRRFEVHRSDAGGAVLLDAGRDVHRRSLTLRGDTIAWTKGGVRHRAPLR